MESGQPQRVPESRVATQYAEITFKVIGAAMRVHNDLGPGLREASYQSAHSVAMREAGLSYVEEVPVQITLEDEQVGLFYLDHLVEDAVVVEEKALSHLVTNDEVAQVLTYLKVTEKPLGLLLNFGRRKLEYKRILPPRNFRAFSERVKRYAWSPDEMRRGDASKAHPLIRSLSAEKPTSADETRVD